MLRYVTEYECDDKEVFAHLDGSLSPLFKWSWLFRSLLGRDKGGVVILCFISSDPPNIDRLNESSTFLLNQTHLPCLHIITNLNPPMRIIPQRVQG